jgi:DNA ligase (NAD+)
MSETIIKKINKISSLPHNAFVKSIKKESLENLNLMKEYCDDIYHNTEKPILTDKQYDLLVEILEKEDGDFKSTVGAKIREGDNRIELPHWLGSLDKIKDDNPAAIERWLNKYKSDSYIVENKLDGISCLLISDEDSVKLYTRGDGKVGADISYLCQYFQNIPKNKKLEKIAVRGELIISKKTFQDKYSKEFSNARNMVSGVVGGKSFREGLNDVEFIAYEVIGEKLTPLEQLEFLKELGFKIVENRIYQTIDHETLRGDLISSKNSSEFEIDGIIIQPNLKYERNISGNPKYAFAFKMMNDDSIIETKVEDIEWNTSKWGILKPRIKIETVYLNGVNINYTTGFNAKFIVENKINCGSVIKITRSGDVIPYIVEVVTQSEEPKMPNISYIWNESKVDILIDQSQELEKVNEMNIKMITSIFEKLNVKYLSEKTIEKLYRAGFDTFVKILQMGKEDFLKLDGVENKLATKLYESIRKGTTNVPIYQLVGASGTLGFGMGIKKMKTLFEGIPNILKVYEEIHQKNDMSLLTELTKSITDIEGFSDKTALQVTSNLDKTLIFMKEVLPYITIEKIEKIEEDEKEKEDDEEDTVVVRKKSSKNNSPDQSPKVKIDKNYNKPLKDMKICFSGFRDKDLEKDIDNKGGKVTTSVSKNTKYLIVKSLDDVSSKINDAKKLGIEIFEKEDFIFKLKN